jgi:hypothetical protein
MAIDPKKNTAPNSSKTAAQTAFDSFEGDEVFTDRPIVNFAKLGEKQLPVTGLLVSEENLNLPKGAKRDGGKTTWEAFVIHLTQPTMALVGDDIVEVVAGREVYIGINPKNAHLRGHLGKNEMVEICVVGRPSIDLKNGNQPMHDFGIKISKKAPVVRSGAFLVGGPGSKALNQGSLDSTVDQLNGSAAQHAAP